jgi:hypothetical protein
MLLPNLKPRSVTQAMTPVFAVVVGIAGWLAYSHRHDWHIVMAVAFYWWLAFLNYVAYARDYDQDPARATSMAGMFTIASVVVMFLLGTLIDH